MDDGDQQRRCCLVAALHAKGNGPSFVWAISPEPLSPLEWKCMYE